MYQDLRTGNDWPVKEAIFDLPNKMKGNLQRTSGNSFESVGGVGGGGWGGGAEKGYRSGCFADIANQD